MGGLSLLELMIFLAVMAIGMTASLSMYITSRLAERVGEERRLASLAAEQKIDEIRNYVSGGNHTLDQAYAQYGPVNLPVGGPGAMFNVPGLTAYYDTNTVDGSRPNPRSIGTVTIINDETPSERQFGYDYANSTASTVPTPPFGVDINGNGTRLIQTGFGNTGAADYNDVIPPPFPLDLNGNGSNGTTVAWDHVITSGFVMLPVVISIQWQGAAGPQRLDMFAIIIPDQLTGEPH